MDLAYGLFMAEMEGHLDTHESKVQKMLRDIQWLYDQGLERFTINDEYLLRFGLKFEELTNHDMQRMAHTAETGRL